MRAAGADVDVIQEHIGKINQSLADDKKIQSMNTILYLLRGIAFHPIIRENNHALTLFNLLTGARK
jgi:hypothetical protein